MKWAAAWLAIAMAGAAQSGEVDALGAERVVFHTVAGDLVFALYPNAAPKTVEQFLRLARAGVYDTTAIARVKPGFIAMVSMARNRQTPLTPEQTALLHKLPREPSTLKHVRGALSFNHPPDDPDGGESSFCVMLGPAPHLDGKYTVFGRLVAGDQVLEELAEVPTNPEGTPTVRLTIDRAEVFESPQTLGRSYLVPGHPVRGAFAPPPDQQGAPAPSEGMLGAGLFVIALLGGAGGLLRKRISARLGAALNLVILLVASFLLLMVLLPQGQRHPWMSALVFFWLIGVFKALSRFEPAAERP